MATKTATTGRESDKFMLRLPEGMRAFIKESAEKNGRTMNAEIVARLQAAFEAGTTSSFAIEQAVEQEQEERGGTSEEALTRLVLAGQSQGGTVLHLVVQKGMSMKEIREALQASEKVIPPEASVIFESR